MSEKDFYYTINQDAVAEFKDRGSRFIAYAYPIQSTDDFKKYLQQLKERTSEGNASLFCIPPWIRWQ